MTAEVVIMNKRAVAIAADSAVTISSITSIKTRTTAEKIFPFSENKPLGFMIYGSADLNGVPWELIINKFCQEYKNSSFDKIDNVNTEFIQFIKDEKELLGIDCQDISTKRIIENHCIDIANMINENIVNFTLNKKELKKSNLKDITRSIINDHYNKFKKNKYVDGINKKFENDFNNKFQGHIDDCMNDIFSDFYLPKYLHDKIKKCVIWLFTKNITDERLNSGVVIIGYGKNDQYPSNIGFKTFCKFENILRYNPMPKVSIDDIHTSRLSAFAQHDMVKTFVEAINPEYMKTVKNTINLLCNNYQRVVLDLLNNVLTPQQIQQLKNQLKQVKKDIIKETNKELKKHQIIKFRNPTMRSISLLSKKELGELAEALIHLTSIKRKTSPELETVAGPIDVAIISKEDGFIWLNKKSYVDKDLNPHWLNI